MDARPVLRRCVAALPQFSVDTAQAAASEIAMTSPADCQNGGFDDWP